MHKLTNVNLNHLYLLLNKYVIVCIHMFFILFYPIIIWFTLESFTVLIDYLKNFQTRDLADYSQFSKYMFLKTCPYIVL